LWKWKARLTLKDWRGSARPDTSYSSSNTLNILVKLSSHCQGTGDQGFGLRWQQHLSEHIRYSKNTGLLRYSRLRAALNALMDDIAAALICPITTPVAADGTSVATTYHFYSDPNSNSNQHEHNTTTWPFILSILSVLLYIYAEKGALYPMLNTRQSCRCCCMLMPRRGHYTLC